MTKRKEGAVKGRPVEYHDALIEELAAKVALGVPIFQACKEKGMPSTSRLYEILQEKPHLRTILARAREASVDALVNIMWEEVLQADDEKIRTAQLRVQTIQWLLARYAPKQFSERVLAELAKQPEPAPPQQPTADWDYLTYDERETVMQLILLAKKRKDETLIEYTSEEVTNDGPAEAESPRDDKSGDHTG